jgi:hypothetical protein
MTDKNENPDVDVDVNVDSESSTENEKNNTDNNNTPFTDTQLVGGILLILIVVIGGLAMFGGTGMGDAEDFNYPDWADEDGIKVLNETSGQVDSQSAMESHTTILTESSYTISISGTNDNPQGETDESELNYQYNSDTQTALGSQNFNGNSTTTYDNLTANKQFTAQNLGTENVTYERNPLMQSTPFTAGTEFIELLSVLNVEAIGTVDNGNVVVYNITGINTNVTGSDVPVEATGEVNLHKDGYFTSMDIEIINTEQELTTTQNVRVTDVGSTTFDEPDWIQDAREQTDELTEEDYNQSRQAIPTQP